MLPGFSASSSLYRSRHVYAASVAALDRAQMAGMDAPDPAGVVPAGKVYCETFGDPPYNEWFYCYCPKGQTMCGYPPFAAYCADVTSDAGNCGTCGHTCAPGGDRCHKSKCMCGNQATCPAGSTCQGGTCRSDCCGDCCVAEACDCYSGVPINSKTGESCCLGDPAANSVCCPVGWEATQSTDYPCVCIVEGSSDYTVTIPFGCCNTEFGLVSKGRVG